MSVRRRVVAFLLYCLTARAVGSQNMVPVNINVSNVTYTSVLVEWTAEYDYAEDTIYTVDLAASSDEDNLLLTIDVKGTSIVLVGLNDSTSYCVSINNASSDSLLLYGTQQFITLPRPENISQVEIVKVYVYNPVLNSNYISAQVIWNDTSADARYDVRVRTADRFMTNIMEESLFNVSRANVNIMTRTSNNTILYPLEHDKLYIVQVRVNDQMHNWSEPLWINAKDVDQQEPLLLVTSPGLLRLYNGPNKLHVSKLPSDTKTPVAIDKVNLKIFYIQGQYIMKGSIINNDHFTSTPFFNLGINHDIQSMAYDWIARRLYVLKGNTNKVLCYLLDIQINESTDKELPDCTNIDSSLKHITVNPFSGYVHGISDTDKAVLLQIQINSQSFDIISTENLTKPIMSTLAEDTSNGCVYVIEDRNIRVISTRDDSMCNEYSLKNIMSSTAPMKLATDERRIYYSSDSSIYYYEYNDTHLTQLINDVPTPITWFDIISPGSQVFPRQSCMSPNISPLSFANIISNISSTTFYLKWSPPNMTRNNDCDQNISSVPPLLYVIDITDINNRTMSFETYQTSFNMTNSNTIPSSLFNVTLRAGTEFFVGMDFPVLAFLTIDNGSSVQTAIASHTTVSTSGFGRNSGTIITPTTSPSSIIRNPVPDSDNTVVIAASIGGGVAVLIVVLLGVIIIISAVICIRSRWVRK